MFTGMVDAVSLVVRSADNHKRFFAPEAAETEPRLYAGKVESVCVTMALDTLGVRMRDVDDPRAFARFMMGFCLVGRAYDEVVDEARPFTDVPVTSEDLHTIEVFHPFIPPAGRSVTGEEARKATLDAAVSLIPGTTPEARARKDAIEGALDRYAGAIVATANNPDFHKGEVLPYEVAIRSRADVTALLGETTIAVCQSALNLESDPTPQILFGQVGMAMQFGDDIFDWRKDWKKHSQRKEAEPSVRPQENLYNATLLEQPEEHELSATLLDDPRRSIVVAREEAPLTHAAFVERFEGVVDGLVEHPSRNQLQRILGFTFHTALPRAPESGRFYEWAKY